MTSVAAIPFDVHYGESLLPVFASDAVAAACLYTNNFSHPLDCPNSRAPFMLATNPQKKVAVLFRPRCGSWSCAPCAEINKQRLILRIVRGSQQLLDCGMTITFNTLTSHPKLRTPAATLAIYRSGWPKLLNRIHRAYGQVPYWNVPEPHKDGRFHWHSLMFNGPPERWLKDNAPECGFGYMVDSQPARTIGGCAWYGGKYLSKGIELNVFQPGQRRYSFSQNFPKLPDLEKPAIWHIESLALSADLDYITHIHRSEGYTVLRAGSKAAWRLLGGLTDDTE